jgi:hypothetical protein
MEECVIMLPPGRERPASQDVPGFQAIVMRPEPGARSASSSGLLARDEVA